MKIKNLYILCIFLILLFSGLSCTNSTEKIQSKSEKIAHSKKHVANKKILKKNKEKIIAKPNKKNVVSFLTKYGKENPENKVRIVTDFGNITIKLYNSTPLHRASFVRLVKNGFYDNTYFYRVIKKFIIQGGDSDDDTRKQKKNWAGKYTIPAEFNPDLFHKRGAIAMTRDYKNNPEKYSAPFDFYIVQGETYSNFQLDAMENQYHIKIDENKRKKYRTIGGAPHLDGEHTVFGEVVEGFDVIDKIANVKTDRSDWPVNDIYIKKIVVVK